MLSPACLARLAALPPQTCSRACLLLASLDLSRSLRIQPSLLDRRWIWKPGSAARLLADLVAAGLLERRTGATSEIRSAAPVTVRLAADCQVTAAALAAWQQGLADVAARQTLTSPA